MAKPGKAIGCRPTIGGSNPSPCLLEVINLSRTAVEATFDALFALTELRGIYRETTPHHKLSKEQAEKVNHILESVRKNLSRIEEDLLQ